MGRIASTLPAGLLLPSDVAAHRDFPAIVRENSHNARSGCTYGTMWPAVNGKGAERPNLWPGSADIDNMLKPIVDGDVPALRTVEKVRPS